MLGSGTGPPIKTLPVHSQKLRTESSELFMHPPIARKAALSVYSLRVAHHRHGRCCCAQFLLVHAYGIAFVQRIVQPRLAKTDAAQAEFQGVEHFVRRQREIPQLLMREVHLNDPVKTLDRWNNLGPRL